VDGAFGLGLMQMKRKTAKPLAENTLKEVLDIYRAAMGLEDDAVVDFFYIILDCAEESNSFKGPTVVNTPPADQGIRAWADVCKRLKIHFWVARHVDRNSRKRALSGATPADVQLAGEQDKRRRRGR
jgi:hypothetical protein